MIKSHKPTIIFLFGFIAAVFVFIFAPTHSAIARCGGDHYTYYSDNHVHSGTNCEHMSAGALQLLPEGYGMIGVAYGSDDKKWTIGLNYGRVRLDGTVEYVGYYERSSGSNCPSGASCSSGGGRDQQVISYYNNNSPFYNRPELKDKIFVGWTWGASTNQEVYNQFYTKMVPNPATGYYEWGTEIYWNDLYSGPNFGSPNQKGWNTLSSIPGDVGRNTFVIGIRFGVDEDAATENVDVAVRSVALSASTGNINVKSVDAVSGVPISSSWRFTQYPSVDPCDLAPCSGTNVTYNNVPSDNLITYDIDAIPDSAPPGYTLRSIEKIEVAKSRSLFESVIGFFGKIANAYIITPRPNQLVFAGATTYYIIEWNPPVVLPPPPPPPPTCSGASSCTDGSGYRDNTTKEVCGYTGNQVYNTYCNSAYEEENWYETMDFGYYSYPIYGDCLNEYGNPFGCESNPDISCISFICIEYEILGWDEGPNYGCMDSSVSNVCIKPLEAHNAVDVAVKTDPILKSQRQPFSVSGGGGGIRTWTIPAECRFFENNTYRGQSDGTKTGDSVEVGCDTPVGIYDIQVRENPIIDGSPRPQTASCQFCAECSNTPPDVRQIVCKYADNDKETDGRPDGVTDANKCVSGVNRGGVKFTAAVEDGDIIYDDELGLNGSDAQQTASACIQNGTCRKSNCVWEVFLSSDTAMTSPVYTSPRVNFGASTNILTCGRVDQKIQSSFTWNKFGSYVARFTFDDGYVDTSTCVPTDARSQKFVVYPQYKETISYAPVDFDALGSVKNVLDGISGLGSVQDVIDKITLALKKLTGM